MNFKALVLAMVGLMVVQCIVIIVVTRMNKQFFGDSPANEYNQAIADLYRKKPGAALIIRACYVACLLELLLVLLLKPG